jgi:sugar/nucleoside kinase (ribokinase family)
MNRKIVVSGTGCCLVDMLCNHIDFSGSHMKPYLSKTRGDGGLKPGRLVFREEFEAYAGVKLEDFIGSITGGRGCDAMNIGGPSIVSLIHAAQLSGKEKAEIRFHGRAGDDPYGRYLLSALQKTPVELRDLSLIESPTPSTLVLSDPEYDHGHGERMFINSIGAAWEFGPEHLDESFFDADMAVFGGTALVPRLHDSLGSVLFHAKSKGCMTVVNTVYDFRSERNNPSARWPMGKDDESYRYIDLLITDREEALALSGEADTRNAISFFREKGVHSLIVTDGSREIRAYSDGTVFRKFGSLKMPVLKMVTEALKNHAEGDTTGCGDNFAGGVIASLVDQLFSGIQIPDLEEACTWGMASGGFACFYMGGTYFEKSEGEKLKRIKHYIDAYRREIEG